ncbi:Galactokinase [Seminavis robusta]|uniref:Galactokinase n=1 Tax=Seminavis robusta TaxID=568900 RepID=A0A9N8HVA1_9STRA|nr:Galactokinase [Seminavis robusta]|eukprot:Sro1906_g304620.1 Galactokinase (443) ;mRNA; r:9357-10685
MELSSVSLSPSMQGLVDTSKKIYHDKLHDVKSKDAKQAWVVTAPGRVNLIGEHTDYTQGFVFPLAIEYSTVVYGTGSLVINKNAEEVSKANLKFASATNPDKVEQVSIDVNTQPPKEAGSWTWYVAGTVAQYLMKDLPKQGAVLDATFAIAGNVPLGSGLSSSASLEVAVAQFIECILGPEHAFSSEPPGALPAKIRAIRCQKAENEWCQSPCGIMDQYCSSAASSTQKGTLLCIDCRTNDFEVVQMKQDPDNPVALIVANSAVTHSIGGGEYPIRVQQCKEATQILQKVHGDRIQTLRDATVEDVLKCQKQMDDVIYRRARHVVTENARVIATKTALEEGDWKIVGQQMNLSHLSMQKDYETSCEEVDILVDLAQKYKGVYGSRLTGGGFGGCCVTLVAKENAKGLMEHLQKEYQAKVGKDCTPFETTPAPGARVLAIDTF